MKQLLSRISSAHVIALIALFVALGGTVYAAGRINGATVKPGTLPGNRIKRNTVTGTQVNEARLGKVRRASNADSAGRATSAGSADNATNATNANALGGIAASGFQKPIQWAEIAANGTILGQSGGITWDNFGAGNNYVTFPSSVAGKAIIATPDENGGSTFGARDISVGVCGAASGNAGTTGFCSIHNNTSTVQVATFNNAGTITGSAFYVQATP